MTKAEDFQGDQLVNARRKGLFWVSVNLFLITLMAVLVASSEWGRDQLLPILRQADLLWLFLGWVCMNLAVFVLGFRWRALLPQNSNVSGSFLGTALSAALLLNYAIPGPFGEIAAAWFVHKRSGMPITTALVAGTTARLVGLLSAAIGAVALWPLIDVQLPNTYQPIFSFLVLGMALCCLILGLIIVLPHRFLPPVRDPESETKGRRLINDVLEALVSSSRLGVRAYSKAFAWSIFGHVLAGIGVYTVLYSLYGSLDVGGVFFSYLTMTCSSAFAFLVPGSQWPWDAVMGTLLGSTTHLELFAAATAAIALRLTQLAMMGVGLIALQVLLLKNSPSE
jgi:hypothetical protein